MNKGVLISVFGAIAVGSVLSGCVSDAHLQEKYKEFSRNERKEVLMTAAKVDMAKQFERNGFKIQSPAEFCVVEMSADALIDAVVDDVYLLSMVSALDSTGSANEAKRLAEKKFQASGPAILRKILEKSESCLGKASSDSEKDRVTALRDQIRGDLKRLER